MMTDPHPWSKSLKGLHDQAWSRLTRGVHDRHASARHPTLANVTVQGRPQARTVVLRAADRAGGTLHVYTDLHSAKVADLRTTPWALLHVWDSSVHLQIRVQAGVTILSGPEVALLWDQMPDHARIAYGCTPPPGVPVPDALAYTKSPDPRVFAVLHLTVTEMEILHLGPEHRRAGFSRADGWVGQWLVP